MTDLYNHDEIPRFMKMLNDVRGVYENDPVLEPIAKHIVITAADTAYNAGMNGYHGDNGATQAVMELKMFLQGVQYGATRDADYLGKYCEIHDRLSRANDPQYKEYLRLKELYGDA